MLRINKQKVCSYYIIQKYIADFSVLNADNESTLFVHFHLPYIHIMVIRNGMNHVKCDLSIEANNHFNCKIDLFSLHIASCHCSVLYTAFESFELPHEKRHVLEIEFHTDT